MLRTSSPPRLFGFSPTLFPFPSCFTQFCDNGPRFLIVNVLVAIVGITLGIITLAVGGKGWNITHGLTLIALAFVNTIVFKPSLGKSRLGGNMFALATWLYSGHGTASLLLVSSVYRGGVPGVRPVYIPVFFFCMSALMAFLTCWHKNLVSPLDENHPSHISNHRRPFFFMLWSLTSTVTSCMIYGCAFARFNSGLIPSPGIPESVIGIFTSGFMVALSYRRYRCSLWGWVLSVFWSTVVCSNLAAACVLYAIKPKHFDERMWYGISFLMCFFHAACFNLIFATKFCLLESEEVSRLGSRSVEQQPKNSSTTSPNVYDLEARAFGMARTDVEPKRYNKASDLYLKRVDTDRTDVGP